jgi:hypothetical protein
MQLGFLNLKQLISVSKNNYCINRTKEMSEKFTLILAKASACAICRNAFTQNDSQK